MRGTLFTPRGLALFALCGVSLAGGGLLAWWQWTRFESASGSLQNLAYVLQWPLFGVFPLFMIWRIRRLAAAQPDVESAPDADVAGAAHDSAAEARPAPDAAEARPAPDRPRQPPPWRAPRPTTSQVDAEPPDAELAAYNRYLAELNARDRDRTG